ncbi:lysoplasmalogenase [Thermodesulfobacteriota bacterium]
MVNILLVLAGLFLLAGLLIGEKKRSTVQILAFKTPLSALFVIVAVLQPHPLPAYYQYILVGLLLGLAGDVLLAIPGNHTFRAGLVSFLAGHVLYIVAFISLIETMKWLDPAYLAMIAVSFAVFRVLQGRVGPMLVPVILYVVVITVMLAASWAVLRSETLPMAAAWFIFVGALCFYVSDLFVARDRFIDKQFLNRLVGLPLYYTGQFLLAFSVGMVG